MIKELFLAIILGSLLGFGVTGGFFALQKNKTPSVNIDKITPTISIPADKVTPTATTQKTNLNITSPENNSVVTTSKIEIKGSTTANSNVIITTLTNSYTTKSDASGAFSTTIDLDSGANQINLTSIDPDDNQIESQLIITYSTAKF
ncbi:MAG: hypothetical protein WCG91_04280 [Candidatus Shapirobacteria bacterium]